jgi:hypothetical protein
MMVILLGATFVCVVLAWLGFMISDGLDEIEARNGKTRVALRSLETCSTNESGPAQVFPDEPEKLETYLDKVAKDVAIEIPGTSPRTPVERGEYKESSTRLQISGITIYELKDFLEKVETRNRLVVITSLHVKKHFKDQEMLNVDMVVTTYSKVKAQDGEGGGSAEADEGKEG